MDLRAASSIGNEKSGSDTGTLACFAVLRGDHAQVLLSNHHVIFDGGGQPSSLKIGSPSAGSCRSCCPKNVVAEATTAGVIGNVPGPGGEAYVDCAIARLLLSVHGINQVAGLRGVSRADGSSIGGFLAGSHDAVQGERVTVATFRGLITGTITSVTAAPRPGPGAAQRPRQIEIQVDPGLSQDVVFGSGDSGAAVINRFNEVVGLMHSRGVSDPESITEESAIIFACPIRPVLDALLIDIPSAVPSSPHAGAELLAVPPSPPREDEPVWIGEERARLDAYERRLRATAMGGALADAGWRHGAEIARLVHHCRPVTVAWHRGRGPAWAAHLLNAARDPAYRVPAEVDGITRRALLERMRDALSAHGSAELAADLAAHQAAVLSCAECADADEVAARLRALSA